MVKQYKVTVNGVSYDVTVESAGRGGGYSAPAYHPAPAAAPAAPAPKAAPAPAPAAAPAPAPAPAPAAAPAAAPAGGGAVVSPMPGTILDVKVSVGQAVKEGDLLFILEAMKMENEIFAESSGTVSSIAVQKGASVNPGDTLCVIG